jgi:translation initiation factor 6
MTVVKMAFNGNPNVGLFAFCANGYCILGEKLKKDAEAEVAKALEAEIKHIMIAGTPMPGIFMAGNSHALLVPGIAFDKEIDALKELGLPAIRFETKLTCLGNNIVVNEHGCLVNPEFSDGEIKQLESLFKVPVKRIEIAGLDTPGACVVVNGKHGIIHREAAEFEIEMVKDTLQLETLEPASVNLGSPYIHAGIVANAHGFVVGDQSGGPEIVHIEESLGYLNKE